MAICSGITSGHMIHNFFDVRPLPQRFRVKCKMQENFKRILDGLFLWKSRRNLRVQNPKKIRSLLFSRHGLGGRTTSSSCTHTETHTSSAELGRSLSPSRFMTNQTGSQRPRRWLLKTVFKLNEQNEHAAHRRKTMERPK